MEFSHWKSPIPVSHLTFPFGIFPLEVLLWICPFQIFAWEFSNCSQWNSPVGTLLLVFQFLPWEFSHSNSPIRIIPLELSNWNCPFELSHSNFPIGILTLELCQAAIGMVPLDPFLRYTQTLKTRVSVGLCTAFLRTLVELRKFENRRKAKDGQFLPRQVRVCAVWVFFEATAFEFILKRETTAPPRVLNIGGMGRDQFFSKHVPKPFFLSNRTPWGEKLKAQLGSWKSPVGQTYA